MLNICTFFLCSPVVVPTTFLFANGTRVDDVIKVDSVRNSRLTSGLVDLDWSWWWWLVLCPSCAITAWLILLCKRNYNGMGSAVLFLVRLKNLIKFGYLVDLHLSRFLASCVFGHGLQDQLSHHWRRYSSRCEIRRNPLDSRYYACLVIRIP